jgi:hypothetical protein
MWGREKKNYRKHFDAVKGRIKMGEGDTLGKLLVRGGGVGGRYILKEGSQFFAVVLLKSFSAVSHQLEQASSTPQHRGKKEWEQRYWAARKVPVIAVVGWGCWTEQDDTKKQSASSFLLLLQMRVKLRWYWMYV